jgi:hypothetical protein
MVVCEMPHRTTRSDWVSPTRRRVASRTIMAVDSVMAADQRRNDRRRRSRETKTHLCLHRCRPAPPCTCSLRAPMWDQTYARWAPVWLAWTALARLPCTCLPL